MSRNGLKDVLTAAPSNVSMASDIDTESYLSLVKCSKYIMIQIVGEKSSLYFKLSHISFTKGLKVTPFLILGQ